MIQNVVKMYHFNGFGQGIYLCCYINLVNNLVVYSLFSIYLVEFGNISQLVLRSIIKM